MWVLSEREREDDVNVTEQKYPQCRLTKTPLIMKTIFGTFLKVLATKELFNIYTIIGHD